MSTQTQAGSATIDQLIINSPYEQPHEHWRYHRETRLFTRESHRRKAGYIRASEKSRTFDDPGVFVELPLVNQIRPRVKSWREADYPGASSITKRLLQHWRDPEQRDSNRRFFFCQLEAIETLMWLTEAPASERVGIEISGDGGDYGIKSLLCVLRIERLFDAGARFSEIYLRTRVGQGAERTVDEYSHEFWAKGRAIRTHNRRRMCQLQ